MTTPIFYNPHMSVDGLDSFSPSASKPRRFVELMAQYRYHAYGPHGLGKVVPVTHDDLCLAHTKRYVDGVFSGTTLNGFECRDARVPESCLWTIGSLLAASRYAMLHPATPVCSPTSGFHHAGYDFGGGFCTFNGLLVVAAKLINAAPVNNFKVAILDCDFHHGNGTDDILDKHPALGSHILHLTAGRHFHGNDPHAEALEFQAWLHEATVEINAFKPDLVLYQAGADPHVKDPLGGFLDNAGLIQRDRVVFRGIKAPIVWCLAGGYQPPRAGIDPVLEIHRNTLLESDASVKVREAFFESTS